MAIYRQPFSGWVNPSGKQLLEPSGLAALEGEARLLFSVLGDSAQNPSMTTPTLKTNEPHTPNDVQQCVTTQGVGTTLRALLIFGIAYALAFKYGSTFSANRAAPLWFPDSVLLCALLISPKRLWPWYLLVGAPIRLMNQT